MLYSYISNKHANLLVKITDGGVEYMCLDNNATLSVEGDAWDAELHLNGDFVGTIELNELDDVYTVTFTNGTTKIVSCGEDEFEDLALSLLA